MAAPTAPIVLDEDTWTCDNPNIFMVRMPDMSEIADGERPACLLKMPDGTMADIQTMNLPSNVKRLLKDIDMDRDGLVDDPNIDHVVQMLEMMRTEFGCEKGHVAQDEMDKALLLMSNLLRQKRENCADMSYRHLSPCIQDVMKEWDLDGDGTVALHELTEAAGAYKKIKKEGRRMKRMIIGLTCVIGVLLTGMFVLSYVAADMAKEMRSEGDGVMRAHQGEVVKVASSDFTLVDGQLVARGDPASLAECGTNTTCRRLMANGQVPLQTAAARKVMTGLFSTMRRGNLERLKTLTLHCRTPVVLNVVKAPQVKDQRTCDCGYIVEIPTTEGTLTLDNRKIFADESLYAFLQEAQCLLTDGPAGVGRKRGGRGGGRGQGNRGRLLLGAADLLDGTFEWFEEGEEPCENNPLPDPSDIPQYYRASVRITELHPEPNPLAFSQYFTDVNGSALTLPGIVPIDGMLYKSWTADRIHAFSTVPGSTMDRMTEYLSMEALESSVGLEKVLQDLGVSTLDDDCDVEDDDAEGAALAQEIQSYLAPADDDIDEPPEIEPWAEMPSALLFNYELLQLLAEEDAGSPLLQTAQSSLYWTSVFTEPDSQDVLDAFLLNATEERRLSRGGGFGFFSFRNIDAICSVEAEIDASASFFAKMMHKRNLRLKAIFEFQGKCDEVTVWLAARHFCHMNSLGLV
ncbi:unnamed protein product [Symbiodinium natans]|uniref:EF-hand domain-containing protein n=1 Tax=Symbiodinium natans TaxID=878477 RepID=A0A812RKD3_9DINO|nr:unnamed protein product [Symbiodinium natans]